MGENDFVAFKLLRCLPYLDIMEHLFVFGHQEALMDLPLRTISYIADIGNMVVLMARGKMVRSRSAQENLDHTAEQTSMTHDDRRMYRMICHVFESEDVSDVNVNITLDIKVVLKFTLQSGKIFKFNLKYATECQYLTF